MDRIELLAPVGSIESLHAAVQAGCDAVYLGYYAFGARSKASFDDDEIIEAINYAHLYGVKVYITVNTIIYEDEFTELIEAIDTLISYNADAFIIQDLGVLDYLNSVYQGIELHASTQMHIHNLEAAKVCKDNGVSRFVAAREMSLEEIKSIKEQLDIEVEVFVHGALCVSYSGQCLMSSVSHNRSGNRGECAQNCRLKYDLVRDDEVVKEQKYLLSTKDLFNLDNIDKIIEAGVDSIKIEGRLKRPEYVYEVVSAYRMAIDNHYAKTEYDYDTYHDRLLRIFNRQFTEGYLFNSDSVVNSDSNSHVGVEVGKVVIAKGKKLTIRLSGDLHIGDGLRIGNTGYQVNNMYVNNNLVKTAKANQIVTLTFAFEVDVKKNSSVLKTTDAFRLSEINQDVKKSLRKVDVTLNVVFVNNQQMSLVLTDGEFEVEVMSNSFVEKAQKTAIDTDRLVKQLSKFGSTIYNPVELNLTFEEGNTLPIKEVNELRRSATQQLDELRINKSKQVVKGGTELVAVPDISREITAVVANLEQLKICMQYKFDRIIVRDRVLTSIDDERIVYINPRVHHQGNYVDNSYIGELGGLSLSHILGSGSFFNVVNSKALNFLHRNKVAKVCLSEELSFRQIDNLITGYKDDYTYHPNTEVIVYNRKELMITKHCPVSHVFNTRKNCSLCDTQYYLQNDFKEKYPLLKEGDCLTKVLNIKVNNDLDKINRYQELGVNNFKLIFTIESAAEVLRVLQESKLIPRN